MDEVKHVNANLSIFVYIKLNKYISIFLKICVASEAKNFEKMRKILFRLN